MIRMNKVLVTVYVPILEEQCDMLVPINKTVYNVILLMSKVIYEINDGYYEPEGIPILYNKLTGMPYNINSKIIDTDIRNGTEVVLI